MCNGLLGIIIFTMGFTSITCTDFHKQRKEFLYKGNKEKEMRRRKKSMGIFLNI